MEKPYVKRWGKLDGFTVFLVDGKWIRTNKDIDFTNFDQHFHKKYIPKKEVWVDAASDEAEIRYWAKSGVREAKLMAKGASYDKAEEATDKAEAKERKLDSNQGAEFKEEHLGKVGKIDVWLVNGRAVRDQADIDFTEGGHDKVYKWIPKDTIYLDDEVDEDELPFIFLHELFERNRMVRGMKYEKAHHLASSLELKARKKPVDYLKLIRPELKRAGAGNGNFNLFDGVSRGKSTSRI